MKAMARRYRQPDIPSDVPLRRSAIRFWQLDIVELAGRNIEPPGPRGGQAATTSRVAVAPDHTLEYEEDGVWRERPTVILGRLKGAPECGEARKPQKAKENG